MLSESSDDDDDIELGHEIVSLSQSTEISRKATKPTRSRSQFEVSQACLPVEPANIADTSQISRSTLSLQPSLEAPAPSLLAEYLRPEEIDHINNSNSFPYSSPIALPAFDYSDLAPPYSVSLAPTPIQYDPEPEIVTSERNTRATTALQPNLDDQALHLSVTENSAVTGTVSPLVAVRTSVTVTYEDDEPDEANSQRNREVIVDAYEYGDEDEASSSLRSARQRMRWYQRELVAQCVRANAIVWLETGEGKTLVAMRVVELYARKCRAQRRLCPRLCVMLVPQIALAKQQCAYVQRDSDVVARVLYGDLMEQLVAGRRLKAYLQEAELLVATGGAFRALLEHHLISMDAVALLVLDECHQARGGHDYTVVLAHYKALKASLASRTSAARMQSLDAPGSGGDPLAPLLQRFPWQDVCPRIVGLTASPVATTIDARGRIDSQRTHARLEQLQERLDARILTVNRDLHQRISRGEVDLARLLGCAEDWPHPPVSQQLDSADEATDEDVGADGADAVVEDAEEDNAPEDMCLIARVEQELMLPYLPRATVQEPARGPEEAAANAAWDLWMATCADAFHSRVPLRDVDPRCSKTRVLLRALNRVAADYEHAVELYRGEAAVRVCMLLRHLAQRVAGLRELVATMLPHTFPCSACGLMGSSAAGRACSMCVCPLRYDDALTAARARMELAEEHRHDTDHFANYARVYQLALNAPTTAHAHVAVNARVALVAMLAADDPSHAKTVLDARAHALAPSAALEPLRRQFYGEDTLYPLQKVLLRLATSIHLLAPVSDTASPRLPTELARLLDGQACPAQGLQQCSPPASLVSSPNDTPLATAQQVDEDACLVTLAPRLPLPEVPRGIIFTDTRATAYSLFKLLLEYPRARALRRVFAPAYLFGHSHTARADTLRALLAEDEANAVGTVAGSQDGYEDNAGEEEDAAGDFDWGSSNSNPFLVKPVSSCEPVEGSATPPSSTLAAAVLAAADNGANPGALPWLLGASPRRALGVEHQRQVLEAFHAGAVSLLCATSVAEEGIDVPRCRFVVLYDSVRNTQQFVQRRGRARADGAVLLAMEPVLMTRTLEPQVRPVAAASHGLPTLVRAECGLGEDGDAATLLLPRGHVLLGAADEDEDEDSGSVAAPSAQVLVHLESLREAERVRTAIVQSALSLVARTCVLRLEETDLLARVHAALAEEQALLRLVAALGGLVVDQGDEDEDETLTGALDVAHAECDYMSLPTSDDADAPTTTPAAGTQAMVVSGAVASSHVVHRLAALQKYYRPVENSASAALFTLPRTLARMAQSAHLGPIMLRSRLAQRPRLAEGRLALESRLRAQTRMIRTKYRKKKAYRRAMARELRSQQRTHEMPEFVLVDTARDIVLFSTQAVPVLRNTLLRLARIDQRPPDAYDPVFTVHTEPDTTGSSLLFAMFLRLLHKQSLKTVTVTVPCLPADMASVVSGRFRSTTAAKQHAALLALQALLRAGKMDPLLERMREAARSERAAPRSPVVHSLGPGASERLLQWSLSADTDLWRELLRGRLPLPGAQRGEDVSALSLVQLLDADLTRSGLGLVSTAVDATVEAEATLLGTAVGVSRNYCGSYIAGTSAREVQASPPPLPESHAVSDVSVAVPPSNLAMVELLMQPRSRSTVYAAASVPALHPPHPPLPRHIRVRRGCSVMDAGVVATTSLHTDDGDDGDDGDADADDDDDEDVSLGHGAVIAHTRSRFSTPAIVSAPLFLSRPPRLRVPSPPPSPSPASTPADLPEDSDDESILLSVSATQTHAPEQPTAHLQALWVVLRTIRSYRALLRHAHAHARFPLSVPEPLAKSLYDASATSLVRGVFNAPLPIARPDPQLSLRPRVPALLTLPLPSLAAHLDVLCATHVQAQTRIAGALVEVLMALPQDAEDAPPLRLHALLDEAKRRADAATRVELDLVLRGWRALTARWCWPWHLYSATLIALTRDLPPQSYPPLPTHSAGLIPLADLAELGVCAFEGDGCVVLPMPTALLLPHALPAAALAQPLFIDAHTYVLLRPLGHSALCLHCLEQRVAGPEVAKRTFLRSSPRNRCAGAVSAARLNVFAMLAGAHAQLAALSLTARADVPLQPLSAPARVSSPHDISFDATSRPHLAHAPLPHAPAFPPTHHTAACPTPMCHAPQPVRAGAAADDLGLIADAHVPGTTCEQWCPQGTRAAAKAYLWVPLARTPTLCDCTTCAMARRAQPSGGLWSGGPSCHVCPSSCETHGYVCARTLTQAEPRVDWAGVLSWQSATASSMGVYVHNGTVRLVDASHARWRFTLPPSTLPLGRASWSRHKHSLLTPFLVPEAAADPALPHATSPGERLPWTLSVVATAGWLPAVSQALERALLAHECAERLGVIPDARCSEATISHLSASGAVTRPASPTSPVPRALVPLAAVQRALTPQRASGYAPGASLEASEFLGDSALKLALTHTILRDPTMVSATVGQIVEAKGSLASNECLAAVACGWVEAALRLRSALHTGATAATLDDLVVRASAWPQWMRPAQSIAQQYELLQRALTPLPPTSPASVAPASPPFVLIDYIIGSAPTLSFARLARQRPLGPHAAIEAWMPALVVPVYGAEEDAEHSPGADDPAHGANITTHTNSLSLSFAHARPMLSHIAPAWSSTTPAVRLKATADVVEAIIGALLAPTLLAPADPHAPPAVLTPEALTAPLTVSSARWPARKAQSPRAKAPAPPSPLPRSKPAPCSATTCPCRCGECVCACIAGPGANQLWAVLEDVCDGHSCMAGRAAAASQLPLLVSLQSLALVEDAIGYRFHNRALLACAFVHPGYKHLYPDAPDYQRLELLGDAVIEFIVTIGLLVDRLGAPPSVLHDARAQITSNALLARVCVALGWQQQLVTDNSYLRAQIDAFQISLTEERAMATFMSAAVHPGARHSAVVAEGPKYLADVVEAVVGAVMADSGSLLCCARSLRHMLRALGDELPAAGHGLLSWADIRTCAVDADM